MSTKLEICNMVTSHLGIKAITSIDDSTEQARKIKLVYDIAREDVLRAHQWNFAGVTEALALLSNETVIGWDYVYSQPPKCLYVRKIFNEATVSSPHRTEFKQLLAPISKAKAIAAKVSDAYIEYTFNVIDPALFDSSFALALSYKIAGMLAQPLTGNIQLGGEMTKMYAAILAVAQASNVSENFEEPKLVSSYEEAR